MPSPSVARTRHARPPRLIDCGMRRVFRPTARLLATLTLLAAGSAPAWAQLGYGPDSILGDLDAYGVVAADDGHESASGFAFEIEEALGVAVALEGEGDL